MKPCRSLFLLVLLCLAACDRPADPAELLIGTWKVDAAAVRALDEYQSGAAPQKAAMDAMIQSMEITITGETMRQRVSIMGMEQANEVPYTVLGKTENSVNIQFVNKNGDTEVVPIEVTQDSMVFVVEGMRLAFVRKKST